MLLETQVRKYIRRIIRDEKPSISEAVKSADPFEYMEMLNDLSKHTTVFIGVKVSAFDENTALLKKLGFEGNPQQIVRISALAVLPSGETKRMEEYVALGAEAAKMFATNVAQLRADIESGAFGSGPKRAWLNLYKKVNPRKKGETEAPASSEESDVGTTTTRGQAYKKAPAAEELQHAKYPFSRLELAKNPELSSLLAYKDVTPLRLGEVGALIRLKLFLKSLPQPFVFVMNGATFHMKHIMTAAKRFNIQLPMPMRIIDTHTMVRYFSTPLLKQRESQGDEVAKAILSQLGNSPAIRKVINSFQIVQGELDSEDVEMLAKVYATLKDTIEKSLLSGFKYERSEGEYVDPKTGEVKSASYFDPKTGEIMTSPDPEVSFKQGEDILAKRAAIRAIEKERGIKSQLPSRQNPSEKAKKLGAAYIAQLAKAKEYDSPEARKAREMLAKLSDEERLELNKDLFGSELARLKSFEAETAQSKKAEREAAAAAKKAEKEATKAAKKAEKEAATAAKKATKSTPSKEEDEEDIDALFKRLTGRT